MSILLKIFFKRRAILTGPAWNPRGQHYLCTSNFSVTLQAHPIPTWPMPFTARNFLFPRDDFSSLKSGTVQLTLECCILSTTTHQCSLRLQGCCLLKPSRQILSLLLELCTHETTSPRTKPSCLKGAGRPWLLAHDMEFPLVLLLPAAQAHVKGWLPFPLQSHIPQLQCNYTEMIPSSTKKRTKS